MTTTHPPKPSGITTIALSARIFVQGVFVRRIGANRIVVRVGDKTYAGVSLSRAA